MRERQMQPQIPFGNDNKKNEARVKCQAVPLYARSFHGAADVDFG
jgi:hypothetical protein